jgi:hypothetical protein
MGQRVHASGLLLELGKNYDHNCELTFSDRRNMKKKKKKKKKIKRIKK